MPHTRSLVVYISARLWLSAHKTLVYSIRASQGSVATRLRCGGFFNDSFIANFLQSVSVKEFQKSAENWLFWNTVNWLLSALCHSSQASVVCRIRSSHIRNIFLDDGGERPAIAIDQRQQITPRDWQNRSVEGIAGRSTTFTDLAAAMRREWHAYPCIMLHET